MRSSAALVLLTFVFALPVPRLVAQAECELATGRCDSVIQRVNEELIGMEDGRTTSYKLAHGPLSSENAKVIRNGRELTPGFDYQIRGRDLTFSAVNAPKEDDLTRVLYDTKSSGSVIVAGPTTVLDEHTRSLVRQALIESALRETDQPQPAFGRNDQQLVADSETAESKHTTETTSRMLPSFILLAQRLNALNNEPNSNWGKPGSDYRGFEGIGDSTVDSPYAYLFGQRTRSRSFDAQLDDGQAEHKALRSLVLLKHRLEKVSQRQALKKEKR